MINKRPEEFNEEQRAFLRPFGVYNLTEIPLVHEGRFIGKISIANKPGRYAAIVGDSPRCGPRSTWPGGRRKVAPTALGRLAGGLTDLRGETARSGEG